MILVFPVIPWGFLWQRPQQLLTRMAASGWPVLYVAHCTDYKEQRIEPVAPGVFHLWVPLSQPWDIHARRLEEKEIEQFISQINEALQGELPRCLVVHHPVWYPLVRKLSSAWGIPIVYDCMDDHGAFEGVKEEVLRDEDLLAAEASLVTCSSQLLLEKFQTQGASTALLRNGADVAHFVQGGEESSSPTSEPPIVGFYGAVKEWVNLDVIKKIARCYPMARVEVIGVEESKRSLFQGYDNITALPPAPYAELPFILRRFSVCLIPFFDTPLTRKVNPVKLYEYLAQGKPVVATRLPELEPYEQIISLCRTDEEFCEAVGKALNEHDPQLREQRIAVAHENSWEVRTRDFLALLARVGISRPSLLKEALVLHEVKGWQEAKEREQNQILFWKKEVSRRAEEHEVRYQAQEEAWRAEVSRVSSEAQERFDASDAAWRKELTRISEERDQMLLDKDAAWAQEVQKVASEHQAVQQELQEKLTRCEKVTGEQRRTLEEQEKLLNALRQECSALRENLEQSLMGKMKRALFGDYSSSER